MAQRSNRIDLIPSVEGFLVRAIENGEIRDQRFELKEQAQVYAERQRIRMRLPRKDD
jgi:hypothetical protein